jgi:hypothetical protein
VLYLRLAQRYSAHFFAIVGSEPLSVRQIMALEAFDRAVYILAVIKLSNAYDHRTNMVYSIPDAMIADAHPALNAVQRGQVYDELSVHEFAIRTQDGVYLPPNDEVYKIMAAVWAYYEGAKVYIAETKWVKPANTACPECCATMSGDDVKCRRCATSLY